MRESSGVAAGLLSLPSGGGGISPLGERFEPDIVRGSGSYAVPIRCPQGPNGLQPSFSLTYSTGSGNGPFGLGWRLGPLRIERRTDRGVPSYTDEDEFVLGDAEVLVPVGGGRYRPRSDTQFWLIERLADSWQIRTGDGRTMRFGRSDASRESNGALVFAWHLDQEEDAAGNRIDFSYLRDGNRLYLEQARWSIFSLAVAYEGRPDVIRSGRGGFLRSTALRASAIDLRCDRPAPQVLRTFRFGYRQAENAVSLLETVSLSASAGGETASFPELRFEYATFDPSIWEVRELRSLVPPPSLDDPATQLVDLTGDGLPDIFRSTPAGASVWTNGGDGTLTGPTQVHDVPSVLSLDRANVAFADLDGDGRADLFAVDQPLQMAFSANGTGGFDPSPVVFSSTPSVRLAAPDTRLTDLDGDGVTDLLTTGRDAFLLFRHEPGTGWTEPMPVQRDSDLDRFPDVSLGDRGILLADMTGDGLQDLVEVQSGSVRYWPYLGNGRWAERVDMQSPPVFPPGFREDRLHAVDVDGDGCTDLVYLDASSTLVWLNLSGTAFSAPVELPAGPVGAGRVVPSDLLGDGRTSFAWTTAPGVEDGSGYRVMRIGGPSVPYLMATVDNGMGGRFEMEYATSTRLRVQDRDEGLPWLAQLPFVVHVVTRIVQRDDANGRTTELSLRYHDGVYDGLEREFRGFTSVTLDMGGDASVPATRQEVTLFQGDPDVVDLSERERQRALAGSLLSTRTSELDGDAYRPCTESVQTWDARVEHPGGPGPAVIFPVVTEIETRELDPGGGPARIERTRLADHDSHGNPGRRTRESLADGDPSDSWTRSEERYTYTSNEDAWLVKLPVRLELRDGDGAPIAVKVTYYDGAPFTGLPEGQADHGLPSSVHELRLLMARLPADYVAARDLTALGYELTGDGDTRGFYAATLSVQRDARGNVVEQRDAMGVPVTIDFDGEGVFPIGSTDQRGTRTTMEFDPRAGEPSKVSFADGRVTRWEHDPLGRLVASFETDADGAEQLVKCWITDVASAPNSVTSIAPSAGGRTRAEFAPGTDLEATDGVSVSRVYYDGFGQQAQQVSTAPDGPGGARRYVVSGAAVLNPKGLVSARFPPWFVDSLAFQPDPPVDEAAQRTRYDWSGAVVETAGPGPVHFRAERSAFAITHFEGDAAGPEGSAIPPGPPSRVERYDARARLVSVEEAKGDGAAAVTAYDLALDGRIETIRDGSGAEVVRYAIAGPADSVRITHRDAGTRTYYRDAAGRLAERIDPDGSSLVHANDTSGRLIRIERVPAGGGPSEVVREVVYDEDPEQPSAGRFLDGRVALVRESGNETRYSYSPSGKLVREEGTAAGVTLAVTREYDLQGNPTAIVYPDTRRVEYTLDRSGSVRAIPGLVTEVEYAPDGAAESHTLGNGVLVRTPRDPISRRLTEVAAIKDGTALRGLRYGYDAVGNVVSILDDSPGDVQQGTFTYDGIHRLIGFEVRRDDETGPILQTGTNHYTDSGDLLRFEDTRGIDLSYQDAAHPGRVTGLDDGGGPQPFTYDARGNTTSLPGATSLTYDAFDRLTSVRASDGSEVVLAYDPQSRRMLKDVTGAAGTSRVRYAAGLYELRDSHAIRHVFFGKSLVASERVPIPGPGEVQTLFYLVDRHGTVLLAMDAAGAAVQLQRYSPFGTAMDSNDPLDRYLGHERDSETGLLQLGARHYSAAIGRFLTPDWYVLENPSKAGRVPQGFNAYAYALNNPLVFKDPSGMWFLIDDAIVAAIGFVVGFVSGLVYGLANGQGWGSLLTALETGLTTAAGAWLGWNTGMLVGGPVGAVIGAVMGGMNGLVSGIHGIYDWTSVDGWFAFLSDSTWSLLGTSLGNIVHIINLFESNSRYREDLSHRQNRHVYEGGFALKSDFAFTQGNVISNAGLGGTTVETSFISNHEELHIWQQRFFGPIFQLGYVVWAVGGFIVGSIAWFFNTDQDYGSMIETATYYDNPFEYWAYQNDNNWPPSGANPIIRWGG